MPKKELTQVRRTHKEVPRLQKIRKSIRKSLRVTKETKKETCPTSYITMEDGESEYIPMTGSIMSEQDSPEEVTLRRKKINEVGMLPEIPEKKQESDGTSTSSEMKLDRYDRKQNLQNTHTDT